ncbi:hypothetical protein NP493_86g02030 [Ridgeia piscesae]|uniref:Uncharacterized protein n=1 Tax=Ridgeia piscesae TaxID=27915 RepID=A0AAD9P8U6_RIDPI|nr:hypothetical protein NP493_86g02030 [Ridgeia piscesae]
MNQVERLREAIESNLTLTFATATAAASLALLYLSRSNRRADAERTSDSRGQAMEGPISLDNQTFEVEPGVWCSHLAPGGQLMRFLIPEVTTTYEAFRYGIQVSNNGPCLGSRTGPNLEYQWMTYQQVSDLHIHHVPVA